MDQLLSLINSMQGRMSKLVSKITSLEAKNDFMGEIKVQLFNAVKSQAKQLKRLKSQFDRQTQEYQSTTESLRNSIKVLSAEVQELRRLAASHSACHIIGSTGQAIRLNGPNDTNDDM